MLNIGPHSLLACRVSAERYAVSLMGFPLWVTRPFSLAALSIFSFISTLLNLTIMCLGVALLAEYLCGVPEGDEENESKLENTLQDIIQENFPHLARQANTQLQEIQRTPQRYSARRATPRHMIVRFNRVEIKERILRAAREKGRVTHKGKPIRLTADLLAETLQARREWGPIFNILKEKNFQPRISYPAKLSFRSEGRIKSFANKQVLRDFVTTRPALQELLKEALHIERINQYQPFQNHTEC
uniref:Uncharacterized protein n=1 Tax=Callithrix jacchus TaxID=9483 RepID=A0A8I3W3P3_CALJA